MQEAQAPKGNVRSSGSTIENPSDLIATHTVTNFEWVLVAFILTAAVGVAVTASGFFVKRLVGSLDKVEETLRQLREDLLTNYVRKDDHREQMKEVWEAIERQADCPRDDCPVRR